MKWHLLVAAAVFCLSCPGQSSGSAGSSEPAPGTQEPVRPNTEQNRVDQRAQSMREQIENGRAVQSHVRVAIRLKNGNKLVGVVKDGRLVERVDGLRFVDAQARERGAGIRLWYTGGVRNYVFVPFLDFAEYEVLQQLSNKQLQAIEQDMQMEERRAAERAAAAANRQAATEGRAAPTAEPAPAQQPAPAQPPAPGAQPTVDEGVTPAMPPLPAGGKAPPAAKGGKAKAGKGDDAEAAKALQDKQRLWFALVQDYPPKAGWNRKKRDEIARRFVVIGAKPSDFEQRFVDLFEQWLKACDHFGIDPEPKPPATGEEGGEAGEQPEGQRPSRRKK